MILRIAVTELVRMIEFAQIGKRNMADELYIGPLRGDGIMELQIMTPAPRTIGYIDINAMKIVWHHYMWCSSSGQVQRSANYAVLRGGGPLKYFKAPHVKHWWIEGQQEPLS